MQYRPKATPPEPKNVDANKKKNADVPCTSGAGIGTSGTKITTTNQFDALNMNDTDDFGIPTYVKEVESGTQ